MARRNGNGIKTKFADLRGLSRGATYRFDPHVARELELYTAVRSLGGIEPATQRGIVERALVEWFERNPISKRHRTAAEVLMNGDGGGNE